MTTPSRDLIDGYLTYLRQCDRSRRTIGERRRLLTQADTELPYGLESASEQELRQWLYRESWARSTKATYHTAIRSFYRWAVTIAPDELGLHTDPAARLERPHPPRGRPRPVTDEQLGHILARAALPYRLWALLAAYAGLRCVEVSRLDREHITEQAITVHGKGDKIAAVPTHPRVWHAVRSLPPGPVALDRHGRRLDERILSTMFSAHCRRLGLAGVTLHRLRHWAGTECQRLVGDPRVTQEFLRHEALSSTMIYTQVSNRRLRDAVMALPAVDGDPSGGRTDAEVAGR